MKRKQYFMAVLLAGILCLQITVYADLIGSVEVCGFDYLGGLGGCAVNCEDQPTPEDREVCYLEKSNCIRNEGSAYRSCLGGLPWWMEPEMDKCGAAEQAKYFCISGYSVCGGFEVEGCLSEYMSCMATSGIYDCE